MPRRPNQPCKHNNCKYLVPHGKQYRDEHAKEHIRDVKSTSEKGYTSKWNKARARFLGKHPLCEHCLKKNIYTKAVVVDHVTPHRGDETLFWNENNWQALCKSCHDRKTMTADRYQVYKYWPLGGIKSLQTAWLKDRRPLKREKSQNSKGGTQK